MMAKLKPFYQFKMDAQLWRNRIKYAQNEILETTVVDINLKNDIKTIQSFDG